MAKSKKTAAQGKAVVVGEGKRTYVSQTEIPNNSLEEALRIPRALTDNYAGKSATPLQVASALDMTPTSGTFRKLCGSSIAYGLTAGGYNAKEISMEGLAKRILAPLEDGDDVVAKREAALRPRILGEFIRKYESSPLPRHDIALNVLTEMGVPRDRAESVYALILDTAQAVGLIREIKGKQYIDLSGVRVAAQLEDEEQPAGKPQPEQFLTAIEREATPPKKELGQAIFVAHGKNKKPLDQLKRILDQFRIPYKCHGRTQPGPTDWRKGKGDHAVVQLRYLDLHRRRGVPNQGRKVHMAPVRECSP